MSVIAFTSFKGGVSKTTSAVMCALAAADEGQPVTLVDADPQRSAGAWWDMAGGFLGVEFREMPTGNFKTLRMHTDPDRWWLIDCPPGAGDRRTTLAALAEAMVAIVPMRPGLVDLTELRPTLDVLAETGVPGLVLLSQVRMTRSRLEVREALNDTPDVVLLDTEIPLAERISAAAGSDRLEVPYPALWAEIVEAVEMLRGV